MKFQVSDGEKYQKVMEAEIAAEEMELPIKLACKRLGEKTNIPGFRKGKAPRSVLESFLGVQAILEEAADGILPQAYANGLKETGLKPCARPEIEITQLAQGEPMRFKAIITVKPEVTLGQYKGVAVTRRIMEITDEQIDKELQEQRQRMIRTVDAADDAEAALGDVAVIDFRGIKDGVPFPGGAAEEYPLDLGSNSFIPGFEEQLVGCKAGAEKSIEVTFPEEYNEPSLAGETVVFEIKIRKIQHRILPELDQAFVEEVSETAENLEQLRAEIKAKLAKQSESMSDDAAKKDAVTAAMENAGVDIPPVMIEQELDRMIEDMAQRLQEQGLSIENYLQYTGGDLATLRDNYRSRAEFIVKHDLVMEAVTAEEDIQVSEEELEKQLSALAAHYMQPVAEIRAALVKNDRLEDFMYSLKVDKASALIYDNAVITDEIIDPNEIKAQAEAREALIGQARELTIAQDAEVSEEGDASESGDVVEAAPKDAE